MRLRLPSSGFLLESLISRLTASTIDAESGTAVDAATEQQILDALEEMTLGHIEYVILEDGDAFVQTAGEGQGPFQLEYSPGAGAPMLEVRGGVDAATMRATILAYRRGDRDWRGALTWTPLSGSAGFP